MEVVDVEDAGDGGKRAANVAQRDCAGRAFEQDVEGLADDGDGAPDDHAGDEEREHRVDPHDAGKQDACAAGDDGRGGEGVAEHVQEDGADVDVAGELPEQAGNGAVHQDSGGGNDHHDVRVDGDRGVETMDGGDRDPGGEDDQGEGALEVDGGEREQDREEVGDVVAGLRDEGQGVGAQAEVKRRDDVAEGGGERDHQHALHFAGRGGHPVHEESIRGARRQVPGARVGFKVPVSRRYIDALDLFLGVCRNLCRPPSILPISSARAVASARSLVLPNPSRSAMTS